MIRGPRDGAVPAAENPLRVIALDASGVAAPAAMKPFNVIVRGPGLDEILGACLGPVSLAGEEVGIVTVIVPGVTL